MSEIKVKIKDLCVHSGVLENGNYFHYFSFKVTIEPPIDTIVHVCEKTHPFYADIRTEAIKQGLIWKE